MYTPRHVHVHAHAWVLTGRSKSNASRRLKKRGATNRVDYSFIFS